MNKIIYLFISAILLIINFQMAQSQTPNGTLDFGTTADGTTATTGNTGFGGVRVGTGGGGFVLKNTGQEIGTDAELRGIAPTGGSINSVGITNTGYGTAAATFTVSFEVYFSGGSSGTWYFFAGNGTSFGSAQSTGFTGSEVFTGLRWVYGASGAITTNNRSGSAWNATGITGTPFAQATCYTVTVVGNNSASTVNYGLGQSIVTNTYDLWVNGVLVGNDFAKALLAGASNINAFRFYSENSAGNVATIALDNIRWWNSCVAPSMSVYAAITSIPANTYTDLNINSGSASIAGDVSVTRNLTMTSGNITTAANTLTLGTSTSSLGTLSYTSGKIIGTFKRWVAAATGNNTLFPVGTSSNFNGVVVNYTSAPSTGGTLAAEFIASDPGTNTVAPIDDAGYTLDVYGTQGYWKITAGDGLSGGTYDINADVNGFSGINDISKIRILKREGITSDWIVSGSTHVNGSGSTAKRGGMSGFSQFAIGANFVDNPLQGTNPIELISFYSFVDGGNVTLDWTTAKEINNSGFEIYRSSSENNFSEWDNLGFVRGNGNSQTPVSYNFKDNMLLTGDYRYRLKQIDYNGNFEFFELNGDVVIGTPEKFSVSQNYPNPFNPTTKIDFQMPNDSKITLKVYDISGKEVKTLVDDYKQAGYYTVEFNAYELSSGIYFYRITAGNYRNVLKMTLIK